MNKIIIPDNRFYKVDNTYLPRVTWINSFYPAGIGLTRWLGNQKSYEEAERIKEEAGLHGTKIHNAISKLINKKRIYFEDHTDKEWEKLLSFNLWKKETNPKFIENEKLVISKKYGYAGTLDGLIKIKNQIYLIDWKSSSNIRKQYLAQISAYAAALNEMTRNKYVDLKLAVLRVREMTPERNEITYEFKIYKESWQEGFKLFLAVKKIFDYENKNLKPKNKEYPLSIKL